MMDRLLPDFMDAAVLTANGGPLRLQKIAVPSPRKGHVLVKVGAVGLNPLDNKIRAGKAAHAKHAAPAVLGIDMAGEIVAVGDDVNSFKPGDRVFGMTGGVGGIQGGLAQYAAVDSALLALAPSGFSQRESAATPLVFITAWEGLVDRANVGNGDRMLVHGGAGGVGHMAIQIANARGADVYATGRASQKDYILGLGATFIDHAEEQVDAYVAKYTDGEGFDVIFDTVGGETLDKSFSAARRYGGHVVSALGWGTHSLAPLSFRGATYSGVFTLLPLLTGEHREHHGEIMHEAARLAETGRLTVRIDANRFSLENAEEAYRYLESGDALGKVVVDIG